MAVAGRITPDLRVIHVPDELRDLKGWLVWKFVQQPGEPKPRKVPHYITGERRQGKAGSEADRRYLTDFEHARETAVRKGYDGVGLALMPEFGLVALDFDDCLNVTTKALHPEVADIVANTYAEISPSGAGVRAFFRCESGMYRNKKSHKREGYDFGFEVFCTRGFVTFTGNVLPEVELLGNDNTIAPVVPEVQRLYEQRFKRQLEAAKAGSGTPVGLSLAQIKNCLEYISPDCSYDEWLQVGMIVHLETSASDDGLDIWDEWSSRGDSYPGREELDYKWRSFGHGGGDVMTGASLVRMANEGGAKISLHGPASLDEFEDLEARRETAAKRFQVYKYDEVKTWPEPDWIIKGVLPRAELAVLYGESGSGKSFVALDMVSAIARGVDWRGNKTKPGRVVYVAAEGQRGFKKRMVAYVQENQLEDLPVEIITDCPNLLQGDDAKDIAAAIGKADVVVLDTFAQVTPGANENASEDMGKALTHCKGIHRATGAVVLLVHHAGKDLARGARGWSGLKAAADAEFEVLKVQEKMGLLRVSKQKDGDAGLQWGFQLDVVKVGVDEDLEPITSCVVQDAVVTVTKSRKPLGPVEQIVSDVIQEMAQVQLAGIEKEAVIKEAVGRMEKPTGDDSRRSRVKRALTKMLKDDECPYFEEDDGTLSVG